MLIPVIITVTFLLLLFIGIRNARRAKDSEASYREYPGTFKKPPIERVSQEKMSEEKKEDDETTDFTHKI